MPTKLVHISDLHFAPRNPGQLAALAQSIVDVAPDVLVVTGDLTRNGTRSEFRMAADFLGHLPGHKLIVPGNHDIPVFEPLVRVVSPFRRFAAAFGDPFFPIQETSEALILGMNTAYGVRLSLDWSLGRVSRRRLTRVIETLCARKAGRLAIVACHHPLCPNPADGRRSTTSGGATAFEALAAAGMDILLHGHLHRAVMRCHTIGGRAVYEICANTALSDRERDGTSGYNMITVDGKNWHLSTVGWRDGHYSPTDRQP